MVVIQRRFYPVQISVHSPVQSLAFAGDNTGYRIDTLRRARISIHPRNFSQQNLMPPAIREILSSYRSAVVYGCTYSHCTVCVDVTII